MERRAKYVTKRKTPMVYVSLYLRADIYDRVIAAAKASGLTRSDVIRDCVAKAFDDAEGGEPSKI